MTETKPAVIAAVLCDYVLQEKDGTYSAIRMVDKFTVSPPPVSLPAGFVQLPSAEFTLFVLIKSIDLRGKFLMAIKLRAPSGEVHEVQTETEVPLLGQGQGAHFLRKVMMPVQQYGLYCFDVYWQGEILTRIPFNIVKGSDVQATTVQVSQQSKSS